MKMTAKSLLLAAAIMAVTALAGHAQALSSEQLNEVNAIVAAATPQKMGIGTPKAASAAVDNDTLKVDLTLNFGDVPFTRESIAQMKNDIRQALGDDFADKDVKLTIEGNDINLYFSDYNKEYKRQHTAFVNDLNPTRHFKKGLDGNIIAIWQSHGWYFEPLLNRWEWQRARVLQTVEDLYTQSYVMPFLNPMLENAGAYVWSPRERDTQSVEMIVDNDGALAQQGYRETNGKKHWGKGDGKGFAFLRENYKDFENPFEEGTFRMAKTTKDKKKVSTAHWDVDVPAAGDYAIYVSYKTLPASAHDALYTINSLDEKREMTVDQAMGGGVWVYLGHYRLARGLNKDVVVLSNLSSDDKAVVTADAVKVGGGMGNIVRRPALPTDENKALAAEQDNTKYLGREGVDYSYIPSLHPRYTEGARYWLQWSGFPHEVYSTSNGINDYVDDYRCRGEWVNYLAGGSQVLPGKKGLNVPVDLSMAFHSDAGTTMNDDIIGTLGIYCTRKNGKDFGKYENGTPRELSRKYTDLVVSEIVKDVRAEFEPNWTRRGMWDKSYYEARVPEVPAMLLELLSHQNFADMKYGLDPAFRFTVSRAIYKGMLKFIAHRDQRDYVVQPLPVNSFAINPVSDDFFMLTWQPTKDNQSDNADATSYLVMERVGNDNGFHEVAVVDKPHYSVKITDNEIHSYKIIALNDGGRSFPSETLSLGVAPHSKGRVMVVNGFTRVSAPDWFDCGEMAGFSDEKDHGVPYIKQYNYLGSQFEFRRKLPWRDDDAGGFGASRSGYETTVIAGNTFDYPSVHGEAIMAAGYSFVSSSVQAFEKGKNIADKCFAIDLIMGKQKETQMGRGAVPSRYKTFTPALIDAVTRFTQAGGNVLLSGAFVATDIWDKDHPVDREVNFAKNVLGYEYLTGQAAQRGEVTTVASPFQRAIADGHRYHFTTKLNSEVYAAESPDAVKASDSHGATIMRYSENNIPAGIASDRGTHRTAVLGFPLETMQDRGERNTLVTQLLTFLHPNHD